MLYGGLMVKHFSIGRDVKRKEESEAVLLIPSTYILGLDKQVVRNIFFYFFTR